MSGLTPRPGPVIFQAKDELGGRDPGEIRAENRNLGGDQTGLEGKGIRSLENLTKIFVLVQRSRSKTNDSLSSWNSLLS